MNGRKLFSFVAFLLIAISLIGGGFATSTFLNRTNEPVAYLWWNGVSWQESAENSELIGKLPHCYLMGGYDNEYIVCPTEEMALLIEETTEVLVTIDPTFTPDVTTPTRTRRPDDPTPTDTVVVTTDVPITQVITDVPSTPTAPPTQTVTQEPPATTPAVTVQPTDPPTPTEPPVPDNEKCNRGKGNGTEGCDPGNSEGKPGNAGEENGG